MHIGMLGLGRMGANMTRRLVRAGAKVTGFDRNTTLAAELSSESGFTAAASLAALVAALPAPRIVWIMLPAGAITQSALDELTSLLSPGDLVVDGGNANYKESQRRATEYKNKKLGFVDAGVSGGLWGLANGYCLMLGGERDAVARVEPFARLLAPEDGWLHCGAAGSGHFVKMIHNGIEYGMMQAMAEGFALMQAKEEFSLDLAAIGELWRHGSVVRSWLLDLTADALKHDTTMDSIKPVVGDNGEGRWTVDESVALGVPAPVIGLSLMMRFATQGKNDYVAKLLATMRAQFGGHSIERKK